MDLLGKKFSSYWEVDAFLKKYELENNIQLICHKSTKLTSKTILKNVSKKGKLASKLNRALEYYNLTYRCAYGVRKRSSEVSYEKPCPFFIQFRLTSDCQKLFIISADLEHKHADLKTISENTLKRKKPIDLNEGRNDIKETIVPTKKLKKKIRRKTESQVPPLVWYPAGIKPDVLIGTRSEDILFSGNNKEKKSLELVNNGPGSSPRISKKPSSHNMEENAAINEPSLHMSEKKTKPQGSDLSQMILKNSTGLIVQPRTQDIPPLSLLKACVLPTSVENKIAGNIIPNKGSIIVSQPSEKICLPEKSIYTKVSSPSLDNAICKVPPLALFKKSKSLNGTSTSILSSCSPVMISKDEHPHLALFNPSTSCKLKDFSQRSYCLMDKSQKTLGSPPPPVSVKSEVNASTTCTSERNIQFSSLPSQTSSDHLKMEQSYKCKSLTPCDGDKSPIVPQPSETSAVDSPPIKVEKEEATPPVPPLALLSSAASGHHKCNSSLPVKCPDKPLSSNITNQDEHYKIVNSTVRSSTLKNLVNDLEASPTLSSTIKTGLMKSVPPLAILKTNFPTSLKINNKNEKDHCYAKVVSSNSEQSLPIPPLAVFSGRPSLLSQPNPPRPQLSPKILPFTKEKELISDVPPLTFLKKSAHPFIDKNSTSSSRPAGMSTLPLSLVSEHQTPETNITETNEALKSTDLNKSPAPTITLEPPPLKSLSSSTACHGKKDILDSSIISEKLAQKDLQNCQSAPPLTAFSAYSGGNKCAIKQNQLKPDSPKGLQDLVPPLTLISTGATIPQRMKNNSFFPLTNLQKSYKSEIIKSETPLLISKFNYLPDLGHTCDNENTPSASSFSSSSQQISSFIKKETLNHNTFENDHSIYNDSPSGSSEPILPGPHIPIPENFSSSSEAQSSGENKTQNISSQDYHNYDKAMEICQELCKELTKHSPNDFNKVFKSLEFLRDCVRDKVPFVISTWTSKSSF